MEYDAIFDTNIHNLIAEVNRTEQAKAMFDLKQQERIRSYRK